MFGETTSLPKVTFTFDGVDYVSHGYIGCQLKSTEWFRVHAGTRRVLRLYDFECTVVEIEVWKTVREGLKIGTLWRITPIAWFDNYVDQVKWFFGKLKDLI